MAASYTWGRDSLLHQVSIPLPLQVEVQSGPHREEHMENSSSEFCSTCSFAGLSLLLMPCLGASLCTAKRCKTELRIARVDARGALKTKPNLYKAPNPKEPLLSRGFRPRTYSSVCMHTVYTQLYAACCPRIFSEFLK